MIDHPLTPNRAALDMRLDAVFQLRAMTINELRVMATRRGVRCGRMGVRQILVAIYSDMVEGE